MSWSKEGQFCIDYKIPQTQRLAPIPDESVPYELPTGYPVSQRAHDAFQLCSNARMAVVWAEEATVDPTSLSQLPQKLPFPQCCLYVVVVPRDDYCADGLYTVRLLVPTEDASLKVLVGPLFDGAVVRRECLAELVRQTLASTLLFMDHGNNGYLWE